MAESPKVLGQLSLTTAQQDLYAVPSATSAVVSCRVVCNYSGAATTFSITVAPGAAADIAAHRQYWLVPIGANDTFTVCPGWALAATDKVRATAGAGSALAATLFGVENT